MSNYYNPVKIIKTENWLFELNINIEKLEISSPVIVTSLGNRKRLSLDSIFPPESIFSEVGSNPNFEDCINAIGFCRKKMFDGVVALGGGSVMDLAKVIMAYLCLGKSNIYELIDYKDKFPKTIPSIFIPTTHGTGSEVTMWGTVWSITKKKKYSISHPNLYPNTTILDGNLTLTLPIDISIITILDALSHSFESIWNKNSNATSTNYAIKAITLILNNVESLKNNLSNVNIRNNLLEASNIAGLAFSNTKTAAAHSISYPLTIYYSVPHGIAASMSLLPLMEINKRLIQGPLKKICKDNDISYEELKEKIRLIAQGIVPYSLSEWGIKENQLYKLIKESFTKDRMNNNVKTLTKNNVREILESIYQ